MKAKEYLLKHGRIKAITRGRISNDNHAFLQASGVQFSDYTPKGVPVAPVQTGAIKAKPGKPEKVVQEYVIFYERDNYKAVANDGKVYGMAEVCNTCRVSLVQNHCDNPTILGDIPVTIRPRK